MTTPEPVWIYLDDELERERLARAIREIRQRTQQTAQLRHDTAYEPSYDGWSLASLLAHLNALDTLGRWQLQAALIGIRPRFSAQRLHGLNDWQRRFFQHTPLEKTFVRIDEHCERLCDFVRHLPLAMLSTRVWLPRTETWSTVERAAQIYFLHHWQEHLQQIEAQDAAPQPAPPTSSESEV